MAPPVPPITFLQPIGRGNACPGLVLGWVCNRSRRRLIAAGAVSAVAAGTIPVDVAAQAVDQQVVVFARADGNPVVGR
ncbi:hypothetical protein B8W66_21880 [Mycobacterium decipiens]|uniref:Uncharacterized protein n=1 Tax=Mycobacterium decipiens TaxID=1430326 RepID=A0A1X2LP85_9MYCO|nr:hypothetical protein B8W66_21880 [Mycobacterium decipiens]